MGPQYANTVLRLKFERGVKAQFPDFWGGKINGGYRYRGIVPVPHYDRRKIRVTFRGLSDVPSVLADGPKESPHRYPDGGLCMWYPEDPSSRKWVFEDGLLSLIGLAMGHLFREAWWRETGEWAGEEVPHGSQLKGAPKPKS